jgi:hypothetical protein
MPSGKTLLLLLLAAILTNGALTWGGLATIGGAYVANPTNVLTSTSVFGVFLFLFGLVLGPLTIALAAQAATKSHNFLVRLGLPVAAFVACCIAVGVAVGDLFQIPISFQTSPGPDNFRQTLGGFVFVIYGFLGVALLAVLVNLFWKHKSAAAAPRDIQPHY